MPLKNRLEELEQPPPGCELLDLDLLLRECGYECQDDGTIRLYGHDGWGSVLTFPSQKLYIPSGQLQRILDFVRRNLEREKRI